MIKNSQNSVRLSTISSILALISSALLMISKFSNEYTSVLVFILYDILPVVMVAVFAIFIAYFSAKNIKIALIPLALIQLLYIVLSMFYYSGNIYGKREFHFIFGLNEIIFDLAPFTIVFMLVLLFFNEIKKFNTLLIFLSFAILLQLLETIYSYINLGNIYIPFFSFSQVILFVAVAIMMLPEDFNIKKKKMQKIKKKIKKKP